jgi:hypothetical protein
MSLTGLVGVVSAISMIITPGFVSGVYKTDTPISLMNPGSILSRIFTVGLVIAGSSQALFAIYLLKSFDLRSQKTGLVTCLHRNLSCALWLA